MKTKLQKRGLIAALTVALVIIAVLVTSCDAPVLGGTSSPTGGVDNDDFSFQPPAGMGYIRVRLANNASRATILPTLPSIASMFYSVVVTDDNDSDNVVYDTDDLNASAGLPVDATDLADNPIILPPGDYSVTVVAYRTAATTTPLGSGGETAISVSSGTGASITVYLEPETSAGTGTFTWTITLPANIGDADAELNVLTFPAKTATAVANVDLISSNTGIGTTLASGFYYVTVAMEDTTNTPAKVQKRTITNILHIYQNITTDYSPALDPLIKNIWDITYDHNDPTSGIHTTTGGSYEHGTAIPVADEPTITHDVDATLTLRGWYMDDAAIDGTSVKWVFGPTGTKVINDLTLYAGWNEDVELSLIINWINPTVPALDTTTLTYNQSKYYTNVSQTLTLEVDNPGTWTVVDWVDHKGTSLGPGAGAGGTITIDVTAADIDYLSPGSHIFTVIISDGGSNVQNLDFDLVVVP
jgi:uncharacterized repeat protein (TIGR02543 family)